MRLTTSASRNKSISLCLFENGLKQSEKDGEAKAADLLLETRHSRLVPLESGGERYVRKGRYGQPPRVGQPCQYEPGFHHCEGRCHPATEIKKSGRMKGFRSNA